MAINICDSCLDIGIPVGTGNTPVVCENGVLVVDVTPTPLPGPLGNPACLEATIIWPGDNDVNSAQFTGQNFPIPVSPVLTNFLTTPPITLATPCGRSANGELIIYATAAGSGVTSATEQAIASIGFSIDGGTTWTDVEGTILGSSFPGGPWQYLDTYLVPISVPIASTGSFVARMGFRAGPGGTPGFVVNEGRVLFSAKIF